MKLISNNLKHINIFEKCKFLTEIFIASKEIILPTRNPCHTDPIDSSNVGSCCVVNSVVPNHGSVLGGKRNLPKIQNTLFF